MMMSPTAANVNGSAIFIESSFGTSWVIGCRTASPIAAPCPSTSTLARTKPPAASPARRPQARMAFTIECFVIESLLDLPGSGRVMSEAALLWRRYRNMAGEHVRKEQREHPHDRHQKDAVLDGEPEQTSLVLQRHTGRGDGYGNALNRNHLPHHTRSGIHRSGQDWIQMERIGRHDLQVAEQRVR